MSVTGDPLPRAFVHPATGEILGLDRELDELAADYDELQHVKRRADDAIKKLDAELKQRLGDRRTLTGQGWEVRAKRHRVWDGDQVEGVLRDLATAAACTPSRRPGSPAARSKYPAGRCCGSPSASTRRSRRGPALRQLARRPRRGRPRRAPHRARRTYPTRGVVMSARLTPLGVAERQLKAWRAKRDQLTEKLAEIDGKSTAGRRLRRADRGDSPSPWLVEDPV